MILLDCFAISQSGEAHEINGDFVALDHEARVFVVADGISGRPGGAVASKIAVETFLAHLKGKEISTGGASDVLIEAIRAAGWELRRVGRADPLITGMGTTLSALVLSGQVAYIAHVGDSRIYRFREGGLRQLTTDHTLVAELVKGKHIRPEMARRHPLRNVLSQSLGADQSVEPQLLELDLADRDLFILVTDGLGKVMDEGQLLALVRQNQMETSESLCRLLVADAEEGSPADDLTVAVVRVHTLDQSEEGTP